MSSREKILDAIFKCKPALEPLPEIVMAPEYDFNVLVQQFILKAQSSGAIVIKIENIQIVKNDLQRNLENGAYVINAVEALGTVSKAINISTHADILEPIEIAYITGTLGVSENGAVWLEESRIRNRLLPFICQHLVIVLDAGKIVATMHDAYKHINIDKEGYGVFLAGPSKTADIEQSLVIGAHGAGSLKVYLTGERFF
jgi:L-lactate dehydrogenase complex protein LldG